MRYDGSAVERRPQQCLRIGRVLYVPSYGNPEVFAAPGGFVFSKHSLQDKGAETAVEYLWPRVMQREVA